MSIPRVAHSAYTHFFGQSLEKGYNLTALPSPPSDPPQETDKVTQREKTTVMPVVHVTRNLLGELYGGEAAVSSAHSQKIGQLADFLDKIHVIDPLKRPSLNWCLTHPFIAERMAPT